MHDEESAALIVGFTTQGLAVARALSSQGVVVYAVERNSKLPSCRTRFAHVFFADDIGPGAIVDVLLKIRSRISAKRVVLFATSDTTVRALADRWSDLEGNYVVSWARTRDTVRRLSNKDNLREFCKLAHVRFPDAAVVCGRRDIDALPSIQFPVVVKPTTPPGPFKAMRIDDRASLERIVESHRETPLLVQQWIHGDDASLHFCTLYLMNGRVVAEFAGRKVMADPPALGIGVILQSWPDEEVLAAGRRFAESLDLDGPIAIEFKRDADGTLWLIEPNAGRSEFCVDLVIQSGVNLVYLEFLHAIGKLAIAPVVRPRREVVWFDTQKDPTSFVMLCLKGRTLRPFGKRPVFPYFGHNDLKPLAAAFIAVAKDLAARIARRIRSQVERGRMGASASG